jgi:hypothetical protein
MSHLVNPTGFRAGKTFLWSNNAVAVINNKQSALDKNINYSAGIESVVNSLIRRNNFWTVKSATKFNDSSGIAKFNVLYYPLVSPILRKRMFPTYCAPRRLLYKPTKYTEPFKKLVAKVWSLKNREFTERFTRAKRRKNLNRMITKAMFRGTKLFHGFKTFLSKNSNFNTSKKVNSWKRITTHKYLRSKIANYLIKKNRWRRWRSSRYRLSSKRLSKQVSKRIGTRVQVKAINVFNYLAKKNKKLYFKRHQRHIWNKRFHYNKKRFSSYYDMVNSLYLLCAIPLLEGLVIRMIQYGLTKMHRRKIRPKTFFYFIDSIVKNMPQIKANFNTFRVIITGKLRGGTARTKTFSTGFGVIPRQTLDKNIRYEFGDIRSKYGSFGVKLLTWRKSKHERKVDRRVKWVMHYRRKAKHRLLVKIKNKKKRLR